MVIAELKIKCWKCGREEDIVEILEDSIVDFNLDKPCPNCLDVWMTKKGLSIKIYPHKFEGGMIAGGLSLQCPNIDKG